MKYEIRVYTPIVNSCHFLYLLMCAVNIKSFSILRGIQVYQEIGTIIIIF